MVIDLSIVFLCTHNIFCNGYYFAGVPGRGSDYIAIGIDEGHVVFRFDLGSGKGNRYFYYKKSLNFKEMYTVH